MEIFLSSWTSALLTHLPFSSLPHSLYNEEQGNWKDELEWESGEDEEGEENQVYKGQQDQLQIKALSFNNLLSNG